MKYVIARTATKNPDINGRTLYLTNTGMWSLDPNHAKKFECLRRASEQLRKDLEGCRLETVE